MSALPASRRLVALVAASGLAVTGLVLASTASAAGACPTYTDPAGDAAPESGALFPAIGEADLDLLAVSHSVDAGVFTSVIKVAKLSDTGPDNAFGDGFQALFTVAGKAVIVRATRDLSAAPVITSSVSVDGASTTAKVLAAFDAKASTVTLAVGVDDLVKAVGAPIDAKPFSAMSAKSASFYPNPAPSPANYSGLIYDTATAPATATYTFGGSCSGETAAAPVGSASPTPSGSASPTPTALPGGLFDQPRKKCVQFTDPAGDAVTNPVSGVAGDTDNDLDIVSAVYKTTPTDFQAYVAEKTLGAGPDSAGGTVYDTHSFSTGFTIGGKAIVLTASATGPATATVAGAASTALHPTAKFDTKNSNIVFSVPLADLAALTAAPVAGAEVSALKASSASGSSRGVPGGGTADSAAPTGTAPKTYTVGDNTCFLPPAGTLFLDGLTGVYTDKSTVTGSLQDVDGANVGGATLTLTIPGMAPFTAVTNDEGDAVFAFPVTIPAGTSTANLSFAGTDTVGAAKSAGPFVVKVESAVLTAVGTKGTVTATLKDNDKTAIAKRIVVLTVGKKTIKATTNAQGQVILKGLAKGTVVQVAFAAVPTYYSAAKPVSAKAL